MGHTIIKPKRDEDFYVVYSSIVDAPVMWGSRADLTGTYPYAEAMRFEHVDETGTSFLGWHGWDEESIRIREGFDWQDIPDGGFWATIARGDLRALCESCGDDGFWHPPTDMVVTWTDMEDNRV